MDNTEKIKTIIDTVFKKCGFNPHNIKLLKRGKKSICIARFISAYFLFYYTDIKQGVLSKETKITLHGLLYRIKYVNDRFKEFQSIINEVEKDLSGFGINKVVRAERKTIKSFPDKSKKWRDIPGYEGLYIATIDGDVYGVKRSTYIKHFKNKFSYMVVSLCKNGKCGSVGVHRIIALCFIPNPLNKPEVNHIDSNPSNNSINNLEWVTEKENAVHSMLKGRKAQKLTPSLVRSIRASILTHRELAQIFNVGKSTISSIKNRSIWNHVA